MKISKRQLRRIIKEEKARLMEYGGRPYDPTVPGDYERYRDNPTGDAPIGGVQDGGGSDPVDDYVAWVEENGHITPSASSVVASYIVEDPKREAYKVMIADAFGMMVSDISNEVKIQQAERAAMMGESKMKISKRQLRRIIKEEKARLEEYAISEEEAVVYLQNKAAAYREQGVTGKSMEMLLMDDFMDDLGHQHNAEDYEGHIRELVYGLGESKIKSALRKIIHEQIETMSIDKRDQLMDSLEQEFGLKSRTTEEFGGGPGGVWINAESNVPETESGLPLFDYYMDVDPYEFGIHPEFEKFASQYGFFAEWNDPGTLMLWRL
jgi:hypothetical protein